MGTCPPKSFEFYTPIAEWDGRYLTNDGQTVKKADAIWLADALERSLGDISDSLVARTEQQVNITPMGLGLRPAPCHDRQVS